MGIEYSAHLPSPFITSHLEQLLPDWPVPVLSVLVVMQHSQVALLERNPETERQKQKLRRQFIHFGQQVSDSLLQIGHCTELFDPKTGQPLLSQPGQMTLDDVAVVQATLGYPLVETGGCWLIEHPEWGTAVFPAVLMSSAEPEVVVAIASQIASTPCPNI
ncbi:MAG: methylmalonic aciduria and homocystinuria type D protein [Cyanobacteria bacterium P01_A01_bin.17]